MPAANSLKRKTRHGNNESSAYSHSWWAGNVSLRRRSTTDTIDGDTQERSFGILRTGGFLVSIVAPPSQEIATKYGVQSTMLSVQPNGTQLSEITELIDSGKLKPYVETVLPLGEARQAHEMSQSGRTRGKIVLQVVN